MQNIYRFESPWLLLLLLILPIMGIWQWMGRRWMGMPALQYSNTFPLEISGLSLLLVLRYLLTPIRYLTLALVIMALARPQSGQVKESVHGEGVDIALALDISGSMASLDFQPKDRLEAAKGVITDFIQKRPYDRIGLVVFASNAYYQSPPTIDQKVLIRLLQQTRLSTELGIEDHTAIGMGLANAANMLKDSKSKSKVVILLTDGVNNAGEIDPLTAAEAAKALGIKVYTIGVGKPGKVPFPMQDMFGRQTVAYQESELDEALLQSIAEISGGQFFRAYDTASLEKIYATIAEMEKSRFEIQRYSRYQERMSWFLIPAMALMLLDMCLRYTVLRVIP